MDNAKDKIATVVDHGNSVELALRLSREFKKVNYFKPWTADRPTSNALVVGDGFENITRIRRLYDYKVMSETDIFVFPEIYDGDLQLDLERRGKRVWGSRMADKYEYNRELFLKTLGKVGLPCPEYHVFIGVTKLKEFLKNEEDWWVKVELRGDGETWHHINWKQSQRKIEAIEYKDGAIKEIIKYVVVKGIPSKIEVAYDGFMVTSQDGKPQFPKLAFQGYEDKSKSHILAAVQYDELCDEVKECNERFAPVLADCFYRSAWGTEIKVTDDNFYFLDATCRQPSPPGEILLEQIKNLGEFIWQGSVGNLIDLELETNEDGEEYQFAAQVTLTSPWASGNWQPFEVKPEARRWAKFYAPCETEEGIFCVPSEVNNPQPFGNEAVGVVVGLGTTIEEAIEAVKENVEHVEGFDVSSQLESLAECLKRIHAGEDEGVKFADEVPEPETAMDN